jgi:hypothetical protein
LGGNIVVKSDQYYRAKGRIQGFAATSARPEKTARWKSAMSDRNSLLQRL